MDGPSPEGGPSNPAMITSAPTLSAHTWKTLRASGTFVTSEPAMPARRRLPLRRSRVPPIIAALVLALVGLAFVPHAARPPTAATPSIPVSASLPSAWSEVSHPFLAYDLTGGPYAKLPLSYAARRDHVGGAREDLLAYGTALPGDAFLRLAFHRRGGEPVTETSAFLDAARLAAGASLAITRSGLGSRLATRFGPFDVIGVTVDGGGHTADCLAFRLADPETAPVLVLTGLACGTVERPVDPVTLACTIDRLDLVSAGDDEPLRAVFAAAERRREDGCAVRSPVDLRLGAANARSNGHRTFKGPL